jgi:hypothetical protein
MNPFATFKCGKRFMPLLLGSLAAGCTGGNLASSEPVMSALQSRSMPRAATDNHELAGESGADCDTFMLIDEDYHSRDQALRWAIAAHRSAAMSPVLNLSFDSDRAPRWVGSSAATRLSAGIAPRPVLTD